METRLIDSFTGVSKRRGATLLKKKTALQFYLYGRFGLNKGSHLDSLLLSVLQIPSTKGIDGEQTNSNTELCSPFPVSHVQLAGSYKILSSIETRRKGIRFSTNLLQDDPPWVEPLEVDEGEDEVDDGEGDEDDGQLPPQAGQQVKGLVLLGESPNVVAESQMFLCHF